MGTVAVPEPGVNGNAPATNGKATTPQDSIRAHRKGLPKRTASVVQQVDEVIASLQGTKPIHSVLVANNGLAAAKFIRSIRSWAYQVFGNARAIGVVAMATPEDLRINAEHIQMADQFVEVPGGTNNNNYANVKLIVQIAQQAGVDAVWPGWGHASENPELPNSLQQVGIVFLGPPGPPMAALGDKIGSSILAQSAGVPTLPWSGSGVEVDYHECHGVIPEDIYAKACLGSVEEAIESCQRIGYPVMLKASWGGGGKGIRKVHSDEEVKMVFKQVQGEVPGSPVFAMKLAPPSRHLEVQLLCDAHGNVCSLYTRDCSVQRRHQKIVEEGPVTAACPDAQREMEKCARALARSVGYSGAATVEFLYCIEEKKYYFLELNPRLQVEHPVTEGITGVNIPSCQLMVGMGVPLWRIPHIRTFFQQDPEGTDYFDVETTPPKAPECHVVAVRITSENASDGFKPTAGRIEELQFRPTPEVWGYFSVKSGGGIHEYSDSQFGHLFAHGPTRASAINSMVVALKDVRIRGEIHTIMDYAVDMLQSPDFVNNNISTGWLDARIAANVKAERPVWHLSVIAGAVVKAYDYISSKAAEYLGFLTKGQLPPPSISLVQFKDELVIEGFKYKVHVTRRGPNSFTVTLNQTQVDVVARKLGDGGFLLQVDGESHVVHREEEAMGTRLIIDSLTCLIAKEVDPSRLLAASPGKLVRYLVQDNEHLEVNQPYAEVEVMKMMMPLLCPSAGVIHFMVPEGSVLNAGDVLARLDLDDPNAIVLAADFTGSLPDLGPPQLVTDQVHQRFQQAFQACKNVMAGYMYPLDQVLEELLVCLDHPALSLLQWNDVFAVVETRLPQQLAEELEAMVQEHQDSLTALSALQIDMPLAGDFPSARLIKVMNAALEAAGPGDKLQLQAALDPLLRVAQQHAHGKEGYAELLVKELLDDFLNVEDRFQANGILTTDQEMIDTLRKAHSTELQVVMDMVISHQGLPLKVDLVKRILSGLVLPAPVHYRQHLRRLAAMSTKGTAEVAARARQLLEHSLLADLRAVVARALSGLDMFSAGMEESLSPRPTPINQKDAVGRKTTLREGVFNGLTGLLASSPGQARSSLHQLSFSSHNTVTGMNPQVDHKIETLVGAPAAVEDALASLILDHPEPAIQSRALITYVRRIYYPYLLRGPQVDRSDDHFTAVWLFDEPQLSHTNAATQMMGGLVVVHSLGDLAVGLSKLSRQLGTMGLGGSQGVALHIAVTGDGDDALALTQGAQALLDSHQHVASVDLSRLDQDVRENGDTTSKRISERVAAALLECQDALVSLKTCSVSVLCKGPTLVPIRNGFIWEKSKFAYHPFMKQVEAFTASLLELVKLSGKPMKYFLSRNRQFHILSSVERKDARSPPLKRLYMRALVRQLGHPALLAATYSGSSAAVASAAVNELEDVLLGGLEELTRPAPEEAGGNRADWVHVFHSVLPALPLHHAKEEGKVAGALKAAAAGLVAKHNSRLRQAGVAVWEVRLRVQDSSGAWRVVVLSPTGHEQGEEHVEVYREVLKVDPSSGHVGLYYRPCEGVAGASSGGLEGHAVLELYPALEALQQKRLAARRHNTTYCYDFPTVFENALREIWGARAVAGEPGSVPPAGHLVEVQELVLKRGCQYRGKCTLERVQRPVGSNDVGMVVWLMTLKTPESPQGRQVVAIANDITYQSGAFSPLEDAVFLAATEYSLEEKLPLVYLAANSGARVGVANEVRDCLHVQWTDESDPARGFQYLYLVKEDYDRLCASGVSVRAEPRQAVNGDTHYVITDVIGQEDGLGVECLSGSGAIASAYCRAFREGFTITLVSGRTVGIGAYLARLGRRCVQRADQPIILTGYAALNKLLGRQVYTSHLQLGGPRVMGVNGVSHYVVHDDLEGVKEILRWLSYTPVQLGVDPPVLPSADPADRLVTYRPGPSEKLDPRAAVAGKEDAGAVGGHLSGLFDKGSWTEAQTGWAGTVVTGRARLAGMPVGVIAVESQSVQRQIPADPGMPDSSEVVIPQAGQVWFPDSADKTAQAIEELDKEGLPLFILANWRGFSGGQRDLFDGVLQAGSLIVEHLRTYRHPVFVYLPAGAELRGGAWVVVDSQINASRIEMYADPSARGGVLEPEGLVEIKFRTPDLLKAMHRLDPVLQQLKQQPSGNEASIQAREKHLLPVYQQMARQFADMHDTPVRMMQKGVIDNIVPWEHARLFFSIRLKRRLVQEALMKHIALTDDQISRHEAVALVESWQSSYRPVEAPRHWDMTFREQLEQDKAFLEWAESPSGRAQIALELKAIRAMSSARMVREMVQTAEGKEGLLSALQQVMARDNVLAMQMQAVLNEVKEGLTSGIRGL